MENTYYNGWCSSHFTCLRASWARSRERYVERVMLLEVQKLEEQNMKLQGTNLRVSLLGRFGVENWKEGNDEE